MRAKNWIALLLLAAGFVHSGQAANSPDRFAPGSMAYVLQPDSLEKDRAKAVTRLAECGRDLIVIDAFFSAGAPWTRSELEIIRGGKTARSVVAYLSIGEAEDYRDYWKKEWTSKGKLTSKAPSFLCAQDPEWKGNYRVKYWQLDWQKLMLEQVDGIVAQGFDGLYLDIVDGFEFFEEDHGRYLDHRKNPETGNEYRHDMIEWVKRIAARCRQSRPNFVIIPQNGSQLFERVDFVATIDAIGIEDLFTNGNKRQPNSHTKEILADLAKLNSAHKPVLLVEYPQSSDMQAVVIQGAHQHGFTLLITDRQLKTLGNAIDSTPKGR